MNLKLLLIVCSLATVFASCSHVYEPALYHQDISYQPKPASFDSVKSATYLSGGLNIYTNYAGNDGLTSAEFNLSRAYVFNNFNLSYGAFGVAGDYQNGTIQSGQPNYFTQKSFGAVGGRASANLFARSVNTDFRYLGVEIAYSHEFGSYSDFRRSVIPQQNYYVDPSDELVTIGVTSEVLWKSRQFEHSFRIFLGATLGNHTPVSPNNGPLIEPFNNFFPKFSYFVKFKNYFITAELGGGLFLRFGYKF
jgi:hypothetical protein